MYYKCNVPFVCTLLLCNYESGYLTIGMRYPDEPLRRNYCWLVPDSLSNYRYYFALLSIEHFLHCSLAALTVFFFLLTNQLRVFWFFSIGMTIFFNWYGFLFFSNIYFFPLTVIRCKFSSSNHLQVFFSYHKGYYFTYIYIYIYIIYIYIYIYIKDLALNNLEGLICPKKPNPTYQYFES